MCPIAGRRVPLVLVNVSRALSSPITLEPEHNDVLAARDSGFVQIHTETCQEVVDSILIAYRIAKDPRMLRPFPTQAIAAALQGRKAVAVIDQNLSIGFGGITVAEIASALYAARERPLLLSYVGGLGGKDLSGAEFDQILEDLQRSVATGQATPPRLLYTDHEEAQMANFLQIAGKGETA